MRRIDKATVLSDEELNASKHHLFSSLYNGTLILVCMYVRMYVYLIDLSPLGLFRANEINHSSKLNKLRIPTGRRQSSWLYTSTAKELNQVLPGTNPAGGQGGTWTRDLPISSPVPNNSATLPPYQLVENQISVLRFHAKTATRFIKKLSFHSLASHHKDLWWPNIGQPP